MEKVMERKVFATKDMVFIGMFVALMAVFSWISIPATVPFTLQTFGVFLAVCVLGGKKGSLAILIYILLGGLGAPVFAGFKGGLGSLFGLTGGYILGFLATGLIMWLFEAWFGRKSYVLAFSSVLGLVACYGLGTLWFMNVYSSMKGPIEFMTALSICVFPYIIPDLVKISLALIVGNRLSLVYKNS